MEMKYKAENRQLTITLTGELDHHAAKGLMDSIDRCMEQNLPTKTLLDLGGLTFMDSSGIGVLIGRCRNMSYCGGSVRAQHMNDRIQKIFRISGLHKLMETEAVKYE